MLIRYKKMSIQWPVHSAGVGVADVRAVGGEE